MKKNNGKTNYMYYWHFPQNLKKKLIFKLTRELPTLRGAVGASQEDIASAIGLSRQTYSAIELQKRDMTWSTYMALLLFFDYNPSSHYLIRQLEVFPYQLDECWLSGKMKQAEEKNEFK